MSDNYFTRQQLEALLAVQLDSPCGDSGRSGGMVTSNQAPRATKVQDLARELLLA